AGTPARNICAICLSRQSHEVARCQAPTMWNGSASRCRRSNKGAVIDPKGRELCLDWQRPRGC
ncbi:hypothetical protein OF83DRAFT_1032176, partial [Amylostereum chailletii]